MIFITGDTHAEFSPRLRRKIFPATAEDYLIICGDFGGVWDGSPRETHGLDWLSDMPFTTLFVDGNHENFDMLTKLPIVEWNGGKAQFIRDNIIHLMRGQVYTIEGSKFFTMGGASSHDIEDGILEPDDPNFGRNEDALTAEWRCTASTVFRGGRKNCRVKMNMPKRIKISTLTTER